MPTTTLARLAPCMAVAWACWLGQPAAARDAAAEPLLLTVNQALNHQAVPATDTLIWGRIDHWATPDEWRSRAAGDCEDFAIAKYFALRDAGVAVARLRLVYVQVLRGGTGDLWQPHLVLAYLPPDGGDVQILDNLLDDIRPLSRRPDLRVVMSFNTEGLWPGLERGPPARPARQLAPWAGVLQRMAAAH